MANNIYNVNLLSATTGPTVTITDDGTGIDWLTITGTWPTYASINLQDTYDLNGIAKSAWGRYDFPGNTAHTLRIMGVIENVKGSNGADFIGGNHSHNILFGDAASIGPGGSDTIGGGYGNDTIYGGAGADSLSGAYDNDLIFGDAGDDTLSGNEGNDRLIGGLGADDLYGGSGLGNTVDYATSNGGVRVNITFGSSTTGTGGHAQGDLISGFNNAVGSNYADSITDTVAGTIAFGYNANQFWGMGGNDSLWLGGGDDKGFGGSGSDRLLGGLGDDSLSGETGADFITGNAGADHLTGGTQADGFIFLRYTDSTTVASGRDSIHDFSHAEGDRIDLRAIDTRGAAGDQAFIFRGNLGYTGVAGQLRTVVVGGNTFVVADRDGDRDHDFAILVQGVNNLVVGDFIL